LLIFQSNLNKEIKYLFIIKALNFLFSQGGAINCGPNVIVALFRPLSLIEAYGSPGKGLIGVCWFTGSTSIQCPAIFLDNS
jgi:hypothetical protein